ncbi:MAG: fused acetyl/propionyl-CoA carboxylase subunit alpha/methylmalonyl-CoA decarboxylase subunit alpha, partial [Propionibacterium sp.]|nr:fused acetyl/propionyl-CoA carboxylase subunit alpha/methylmalonyl-CoA decarboxylase subunit alpha [Propionibacterium sp.]
AMFRVFLAHHNVAVDVALVVGVLERWLAEPAPSNGLAVEAWEQLERLKRATQLRFATLGDLARSARFRWFDQPMVDEERARIWQEMLDEVATLAADPSGPGYADGIARLQAIPEKNDVTLAVRLAAGITGPEPMLEVLARKHYEGFGLHEIETFDVDSRPGITGHYEIDGRPTQLISTLGDSSELDVDGPLAGIVADRLEDRGAGTVVELYVAHDGEVDPDSSSDPLRDRIAAWLPSSVRRIVVGVCTPSGQITYVTYRWGEPGELVEDEIIRGHHPMVARRLDLWRLREFDISRLAAPEDVLLIEAVAKSNPADRRLIAMAQVRQLAVVRDEHGRLAGVPHAERAIENCLEAIRRTRTGRGREGSQLDMNHVWVHVWPEIELDPAEAEGLQQKITPLTDSAGISEVLVHGTFALEEGPTPLAVRFHRKVSGRVGADVAPPNDEVLTPLDDYQAKVVRARRRGLVYPYELAPTLAGEGGSLVELDLDADGNLVDADRPFGLNTAGIIVARVTTPTELHPEGIVRIVLAGDPTKGLGAVAEPECRRIIAA